MGAAFDILAIAVRPKLQRSGVGSSLMSDAEALARSERFHAMTLSVHTDNMQAISFYEKLGWQKHSRPGTPWAGAMEKWLIPRPVVSAPPVEMPQVGV